ncbi:malectin domain-containing carbohydrate-binding protein [Persicobacter diffluens]|uniref:malectin domain-containing carbohydrate-binding protein n=1 Tax=Persicobacter diffluens TaxID=981 RepID=UPI0030C66E70
MVEYISNPAEDANFFLNAGQNSIRSTEEEKWLNQRTGNRYNDLARGDFFWNSHRFGQFSYRIPLENGLYQLNLFFKEIYFKETNQRDFHVKAEDRLLLENFNPDPAAGEITKTFQIEIKDGAIDLQFLPGMKNHPMLSALSLTKIEQAQYINAGNEKPEEASFYSGGAFV